MNKLEVINENLLADSSNMENTAYIQKQMELIEQEIYLHERREEEDDLQITKISGIVKEVSSRYVKSIGKQVVDQLMNGTESGLLEWDELKMIRQSVKQQVIEEIEQQY